MSHRQALRRGLEEGCALHRRPISLAEILAVVPVHPPHPDAVIGSLVRTQHAEALPARMWNRERRRVYRPAGNALVVCEAATPITRGEAVAAVIAQIWAERRTKLRPISSKEIRAQLRLVGDESGVLGHPALLPTVLLALSRPAAGQSPVIQSVIQEGVRAQGWIPFAVKTWSSMGPGTGADRLARLVNAAAERKCTGMVTARDVQSVSAREEIISAGIPRLLSEATRMVSNGAVRIKRKRPEIVCLGTLGGTARYTSARGPVHTRAVAAFAAGRFAEGWDARRINQEWMAIQSLSADSAWRPIRASNLRSVVAKERIEAEAFALRSSTPNARMSRADALDTTLAETLSGAEMVVVGDGGKWVSPTQATELLKAWFELGSDHPLVEGSFLGSEVVRRRHNPTAFEQTKSRARPIAWDYDEVSLLHAGAVRWGCPESVVMARLAKRVLGLVRDADAVLELAKNPRIARIDLIAALAVLGEERGREYLSAALADNFLSATARDFAERGLRILAWQQCPEGRSPWTA